MKKNKGKNKKQGGQLSLIDSRIEKIKKPPFIWLNITLFKNEIYGKKITKEYKGHILLDMVTKYGFELK